MNANTHVGEIGINYEGRYYKFRPSFYALTKLGSEYDLVDIYNNVLELPRFLCVKKLGDELYIGGANGGIDNGKMLTYLHILSSFYEGDQADLWPLFGHYKGAGNGLRYVFGKVPLSDIATLAVTLIKNAIIGRPSRKAKGGKEAKTFSPSEFVACAVAHIGISPDEAWKMTMMEFQQAMQAKYPEDAEDEKHVNAEDHDKLVKKTEEALKRIGAL